MTLTSEHSTFTQTKYMTNLSTILKKNVVIIKKHLRRKTASLEEEPKKIVSSVSKHLMYVFTSHHPLQTKIKDLFKTYNKDRNKSTQYGNTKSNLDYKEETLTEEHEEQKDHGIGSNMTEQGMNIGINYVPILLNVSVVESKTAPNTDRNINTTRQHYEREGTTRECNCGTKYVVPKRI